VLVSTYLRSKADCKAEAVPYGVTKNEVTICSIRFLRPKNRERIKQPTTECTSRRQNGSRGIGHCVCTGGRALREVGAYLRLN
jgi:hypothetical protein